MRAPLKILIVDPSAAEALAIQTQLRSVADFEFCIDHCLSVENTWPMLLAEQYDAILIDPDIGGLQAETLLGKLKQNAGESTLIALSRNQAVADIAAEADTVLFKDKADGNRIALAILGGMHRYQRRPVAAPLRTSPVDILNTIQPKLLQRIDNGAELKEVLDELIRFIESLPGVQCVGSILLLDPGSRKLHLGAAPSLPVEYNQAIEGLVVGPSVGSCGTAAFCKHSIYVVDIQTDPLWQNFRDLARTFNLRACWSIPVLDKQDNVLGTFALYYKQRKMPTREERGIIHAAATTTAFLIERSRIEENREDAG